MGEGRRTPGEYLTLVKRRRLSLMLPFFAVLLLSVVVALVLPPTYRSVATILVEGEEIPPEFAENEMESFAKQRLRSIRQRVLGTGRLLEIIKRQDLYGHGRGQASAEEMVAAMRDDIRLDHVGTEIVERPVGQPATGAMTFTLSFAAPEEPQRVRTVANILAALFLEENLRDRDGQALAVAASLEEKQDEVRADLEEVARNIAVFKKEHINELPEVLPVNLQSRHAVDAAIEKLTDQARTLRERESRLVAERAAVSPRLEEEEMKRLASLQAERAELESRYTAGHPNVARIRQEIARLERRLAARTATAAPAAAENPVFVELSDQLAAIRAELKSTTRQLADLQARRATLTAWIEAAPRVEMDYHALLAWQRDLQARSEELSRRLQETMGAAARQEERKGERFTLIDPPSLPERPWRPNRPVIVLAGALLGLLAGVVLAALLEFCDSSVRLPETLERETSFPVLAAIPFITRGSDTRDRTGRWVIILAVVVLLVAAVLVAAAVFMPDPDGFRENLLRLIPWRAGETP